MVFGITNTLSLQNGLEVLMEMFMVMSFVECISGASFHSLHWCNPGVLQPCKRGCSHSPVLIWKRCS